MVSKSNYFFMALMMVVVFFLFQFIGVTMQLFSSSEINSFAEFIDGISAAFGKEQQGEETVYAGKIAFIGEDNEIISDWCSGIKYEEYRYNSIISCDAASDTGYDVVIIDPSYFNASTDLRSLQSLCDKGVSVIFTDFPAYWQIEEYSELRNVLGITSIVDEEVTLEGVEIYSGILIGGNIVYEQMAPTVQWYTLGAGTKVYSTGLLDNSQEGDDLPKLIWRNAYSNSMVFVINGCFTQNYSVTGILSSLMSEIDGVFIYPITNAQLMIVQNLPYLASENEAAVTSAYSMSTSRLFMDIIWPSIVSGITRSGDSLTCMLSVRLDYDAEYDGIDEQTLDFYMRQIERQTGEVGISGSQISALSAEEKLTLDYDALQELLPSYVFAAFSPDSMQKEEYEPLMQDGELLESVSTIILPKDDTGTASLFTQYTNGALGVRVITDSFEEVWWNDLLVRSIETAYGLSSTVLDLEQIIYPQDDDDYWSVRSKEWTNYMAVVLADYTAFDKVTVSEANVRINQYLAMSYTSEREDNTITVSVDRIGEACYFVLRLSNETIDSISGGNYTEIESGFYLISAESDNLVIGVKNSDLLS